MSKRSLTLDNLTVSPALFLAPMAGITHSAFRRLISDFGGYGALYTEMLSGSALLRENVFNSPFTKRRACEGTVIYQLRLTGKEEIKPIIERLDALSPDALDINLGCPAPEIRRIGAGTELFNDINRLELVISSVRKYWNKPFTIKCRIGSDHDSWQAPFVERLRLFENNGVDAITIHPRFSDEKLKRRARIDQLPWIASQTRLPIIANGDFVLAHDAREVLKNEWCKGLMLGRITVVQPWIFAEISNLEYKIDYLEIWTRLLRYILEDFPPQKAIGRIKEFTAYYSRNFFFGHELFTKVQSAQNLEELENRAVTFLSSLPKTVKIPSIAGI